jgi:hypothetical protein
LGKRHPEDRRSMLLGAASLALLAIVLTVILLAVRG